MGYEPTDTYSNPHRPDLKPVDPRKANSAPNDFKIHGSIDNQSCFNAATGESEDMPY